MGKKGLNATVLPTHTNVKTNILLWNGLIYIWAVSRDSPLPHGGLTEVNYYCIGMLSCYCIISDYIGLPKKYLEFNQTKAIVRVYGPGSNVLYSLYTNTHPLYGVIIKLEK